MSEISPYEEEQCIVEILHRKGPKAFLLTEPDCRLTKKGHHRISYSDRMIQCILGYPNPFGLEVVLRCLDK